MEKFRERVRKHFVGMYDNNDDGHKIDHADDVVDIALLAITALKLPKQLIPQAIVAGYAHDAFADVREDHHEKAAEYILSKAFRKKGFLGSDKAYQAAADAAREHRASWCGEYSGLLSEIISAADRGYPDVAKMYQRSYDYIKTGLPHEEALEHALVHILEKYGTGGYGRFPHLYSTLFGDSISAIQKEVDAMTIDGVAKIILQ